MPIGLDFPFRPPGNVDDFRRYVLTQPALQQQLQALENRALFAEKVKELGTELGFNLRAGDVEANLRCAPLSTPEQSTLPPPAWTPTRTFVRDRQLMAEWTYAGTRRFTEPFFEHSVKVALRHPFAKLFRLETPLAVASRIEPDQTLEPNGFIFHMSRCGSTLISQMLATLPDCLMLSEPPPVDEVIQAKRQVEKLAGDDHIQWLRWMVSALGRRRTGGETNYFIKMDAWNIHDLSLIRAAFPHTPWIFLHRDPLEVMVSQLSMPGMLSMPGAVDPGLFGLTPADVTGLLREEWCMRVLAGIMRAAVAARHDPHALFVSYRDLPDAVFDPIARHFGVNLSGEDVACMRQVTAISAKTPQLLFESDSEAKRLSATPLVRDLCSAHLSELYRELESIGRGAYA